MKREIRKYLFDIKTSIDSINEYLGEKRNFFEYQNNKLLRRGIEREIEIIEEAMNRALKLDPDLDIKNARQIVDTRNWVIHGYDKVDDRIEPILIDKNNDKSGFLDEIKRNGIEIG